MSSFIGWYLLKTHIKRETIFMLFPLDCMVPQGKHSMVQYPGELILGLERIRLQARAAFR
jgi:hypothetical protein